MQRIAHFIFAGTDLDGAPAQSRNVIDRSLEGAIVISDDVGTAHTDSDLRTLLHPGMHGAGELLLVRLRRRVGLFGGWNRRGEATQDRSHQAAKRVSAEVKKGWHSSTCLQRRDPL